MSKVCSVCGKGNMTGNNVSHSNVKSKRTLSANLHKVEVCDDKGKVERKYVCTKCMKGSKKDI
ncbi:MAG: 50S ribosomal protein L28 [Clostridia bacterium]